jgi:putative transposase
MVPPGAKREAVAHAREHHGLSERRACSLVGVSRRVVRYEPTRGDDGVLRTRLRELRRSAAGLAIGDSVICWRATG